jgi:hypothetical protein
VPAAAERHQSQRSRQSKLAKERPVPPSARAAPRRYAYSTTRSHRVTTNIQLIHCLISSDAFIFRRAHLEACFSEGTAEDKVNAKIRHTYINIRMSKTISGLTQLASSDYVLRMLRCLKSSLDNVTLSGVVNVQIWASPFTPSPNAGAKLIINPPDSRSRSRSGRQSMQPVKDVVAA